MAMKALILFAVITAMGIPELEIFVGHSLRVHHFSSVEPGLRFFPC